MSIRRRILLNARQGDKTTVAGQVCSVHVVWVVCGRALIRHCVECRCIGPGPAILRGLSHYHAHDCLADRLSRNESAADKMQRATNISLYVKTKKNVHFKA